MYGPFIPVLSPKQIPSMLGLADGIYQQNRIGGSHSYFIFRSGRLVHINNYYGAESIISRSICFLNDSSNESHCLKRQYYRTGRSVVHFTRLTLGGVDITDEAIKECGEEFYLSRNLTFLTLKYL